MKIRGTRALQMSLAGGVAIALALLLATVAPAYGQAVHTSSDWAQSPPAFDDGSTLRDFQTRQRSALLRLKDDPSLDQPLKLTARVTAESRTGVRRLRIRDFQLLSDGSRESGEFELAPGSWPSVVSALGSAVAGDFLTQASLRGIPLDSLEVVFSSRPGAAPSKTTGREVRYPRNLSYLIFVESPASDEELESLRQTVERVSPVLNLVTGSQPIAHGRVELVPTPAARDGKTLAGLREFLEDKYAASQGAKPPPGESAGPRRSPDDWRPPLRAHVKVEGGTGIRHVRTDVSNYQILHDYPRYLAGRNLGPVPEEDLLGRMITCLAHIYEIEASRKRLAIDALELEVEGTLTTRLGNVERPPTYRDIGYRVRIASPEPREKIDALQREVEAICPIYNMLKDGQPVSGKIVRGPYSPAKERAALERG